MYPHLYGLLTAISLFGDSTLNQYKRLYKTGRGHLGEKGILKGQNSLLSSRGINEFLGRGQVREKGKHNLSATSVEEVVASQ